MKYFAFIGLFVIFQLSLFAQDQKELVTVRHTTTLMGSPVELTIIAQNEELGYIYVEEGLGEIRRIEKLISSWDPVSLTSKINDNAGLRPVEVTSEYLHLMERVVQISELTSGHFDITSKVLEDLWKFDGSMRYLPTPAQIRSKLEVCGYTNIIIDKDASTVFLKKKGMKIGFSAIGKGFAADKAKSLLMSKQVPGGMINIDGEITVWGTKATGEKWLLGVSDPLNLGGIIQWIPLIESSVSISRLEDAYIRMNDKIYGHILNPVTGYPVSDLKEITVFARSAELSDALATALFAMGIPRALQLINQLGDTEAILVDQEGLMYWTNGLMLDAQ